MSAPQVRIDIQASGDNSKDVEMDTSVDVESGGLDEEAIDEALVALESAGVEAEDVSEVDAAPKPSFVDYLKSSTIEVIVGSGESQTQLYAHEALLNQSPFFAEQIAAFTADQPRHIEFPSEDLDAMGAFLQFLYTGEYYPRKTSDGKLEGDSKAEPKEDDGRELLRHARVYTLAEKLGAKELKALAHSKVHRVNSTAKGELEYARYVYGHTGRADDAIRRPIASFWGQRSHVLRHEAEAEFRALCIEFPEFSFDVLSHVLDARERRGRDREAGSTAGASSTQEPEPPRSGRKRARHI